MASQLIEEIKKTNTLVCVGLDPMLSYAPEHMVKKSLGTCGETLEGAADATWQSNEEIIDHTFDLIPTAKPRIATYKQFGIEGLTVYKRTVDYCHERGLIVIGDAKRGDIGSTSAAYTAGYLGRVQMGSKSLSGLNVDVLTVNPYLGTDGMKSSVNVCKSKGEGLSVPVKTSNPSSGEFQDRLIGGKPLYERVATRMEEWGFDCMDDECNNMGAVVGATYPGTNGILRKLMSHTYFLVPGYGTQGGTATDLRHCFNQDGLGAVVNSSREIVVTYKQERYKNSGPEHFGGASKQAATDMTAGISSIL